MIDLLASLDAIEQSDREMIKKNLLMMTAFTKVTKDDARRIDFAMGVVENREIMDFGIPMTRSTTAANSWVVPF